MDRQIVPPVVPWYHRAPKGDSSLPPRVAKCSRGLPCGWTIALSNANKIWGTPEVRAER